MLFQSKKFFFTQNSEMKLFSSSFFARLVEIILMKNKKFVLLFSIDVSLQLVRFNFAQSCPANRIWHSCGSACPPSCYMSANVACTQQCVAGCFCNPGYLLTRSGECVLPGKCGNNNGRTHIQGRLNK